MQSRTRYATIVPQIGVNFNDSGKKILIFEKTR